jgi:hypothetical protein
LFLSSLFSFTSHHNLIHGASGHLPFTVAHYCCLAGENL